MSELKVRVQTNYGQKRIYPVCEKSHMFAMIAQRKTLDGHTIGLIKRLGYTFDVETETV